MSRKRNRFTDIPLPPKKESTDPHTWVCIWGSGFYHVIYDPPYPEVCLSLGHDSHSLVTYDGQPKNDKIIPTSPTIIYTSGKVERRVCE